MREVWVFYGICFGSGPLRFHWEMLFRARDLRRSLDTVIMHADRRTDQLMAPDDADWGWRPDVFAQAWK